MPVRRAELTLCLPRNANAPAARKRPGAGAKEVGPLAQQQPNDESTRAEMAGNFNEGSN